MISTSKFPILFQLLYVCTYEYDDQLEGILTMFQTDSSFRGVRFFALWRDGWHTLSLEDCRFKFLQAFPQLEELSIISNYDGLSPETEGPDSWNEGNEMRFLDSPRNETLSSEKKSYQDYMTTWDDRRGERFRRGYGGCFDIPAAKVHVSDRSKGPRGALDTTQVRRLSSILWTSRSGSWTL